MSLVLQNVSLWGNGLNEINSPFNNTVMQFNFFSSRFWLLTLSQTSPGFYVSAVQVFWKHCGKKRNCLLLFTRLKKIYNLEHWDHTHADYKLYKCTSVDGICLRKTWDGIRLCHGLASDISKSISQFASQSFHSSLHACIDSLPHKFIQLLTNLYKKPFENILEKGENTGNQHFLLFPQCSQAFPEQISIFQSCIFYCLRVLSICTSLKFCCLLKG